MPFVKLIVPLGLMLFGGIEAFMGFAVLVSAVLTGEITYSYGTGADPLLRTLKLSHEPRQFWSGVMLLAVLPLVGGAAAVWYGRRKLYG